MPKKYHIDVQPIANRFPVIGRSGIVDWGEGCLKCAKCVKTECVYGVYKNRSFSASIFGDTIDQFCKSCFRCVQGCPKRLIHKTINPEWEALGDELYTPEIISVTWEQSATGKIPVSGAGYGGKFSGPGFDSMWTDMSEIVRPTRDGIHGREYISTVVDLGRRLDRLEFDKHGKLLSQAPPSLRIPLPIVFDVFPFGDLSSNVWSAVASSATRLGTLAFMPHGVAINYPEQAASIVPVLSSKDVRTHDLSGYRCVELVDEPETAQSIAVIKQRFPCVLISIRMEAKSSPESIRKVLEYNALEADIIHYVADESGYEPGTDLGLHIKDVIKEINAGLLKEGLRDKVTVIASGGIAMAEHVTKAMLCGANLVGVDIPLLIALECRVCRNCKDGLPCPVSISNINPKWGAQRMVNLIGAWHNQLLEMMGAMGIREARRLRGERGRVMFREDLENDTFAQLFSDRIS
ncbi:MAG: glutamate synthase-related protein [Desulfomonilaceae bacterium]